MGMGIVNNIYSMNSYRHLSETRSELSSSVDRLSSGFRINEAADDAVGLAISEKLRAQISGHEVAVRNAQDGISIVQTADGALDRASTIISRIHDLAELAANGDKTDADRAHYQKEVDQLLDEIDRIGRTTEYNTKKLLDGSVGSQAKEVGDIDSINDAARIKVVSAPKMDGEYQVTVKQAATKATALITSAGVNNTIDDTFSAFVGGNDGIYAFRFDVDGKQVAVNMTAESGKGDTISEVLNIIDKAFDDAGIEAHAKFVTDIAGSTIDGIEIEADNFGSAHDIHITVVNQPGALYGDASYNADDGTGGAIYNSDRSLADGTFADTMVLVAADDGTSDKKAILSNSYKNTAFTFSDTSGKTAAIDISEGDTIADLIGKINNLDVGDAVNVRAYFDEKTGSINVYSKSSGSDPLSIKGMNNSDKENEVLAMLGIYGEHYGGDVEGKTLSATVDYHLKIADPENHQVDVFGRFGSRDTNFEGVKSSSAVTESGVHPGVSGSEVNEGINLPARGNRPSLNASDSLDANNAGGIAGISFKLEEKTLAGGEHFSILVSHGELDLQIGSNTGQSNRMGLSIDKISTDELGIRGLDIGTQANAQSVMDSEVLDNASAKIALTRSKLGAIQNRLGHTLANLSITSVNLSSAESRIRDTDFAKETMGFTRHQIMSQAGANMLKTANMMPSMVLDLIG